MSICDEIIQKPERIESPCCKNQMICNDGDKSVCLSCGIVNSYNFVNEYVNFYDNKYKFYRKSIYHRKYHIDNVLSRYHISAINKNKVMLIFKEIGQILPLINKGRKRMINLKFILKQVFLMLDLDIDVNVCVSGRTLKNYNNYWLQILLLKFDRIIKIIK